MTAVKVFPPQIHFEQQFCLKVVDENDAETFYESAKEHLDFLHANEVSTSFLTSLEELKKFIGYWNWHRDRKVAASYGLWVKKEWAGFFRIQKVNWKNKSAELDGWLVPQHCGKGLGTLSLMSLIDTCFGDLDLSFLSSTVSTHNYKAQRLLKKLGFVEYQWVDKKIEAQEKSCPALKFQLQR